MTIVRNILSFPPNYHEMSLTPISNLAISRFSWGIYITDWSHVEC